MSPGTASGAVSAVVGGMAVGRLLVGALARHRGRRSACSWSASRSPRPAGCWSGCRPPRWPPSPACSIVGLGVAGQYPLGAAMVMALSGGQPDRAIAVMSIGVGLASGLGPFVLGALADQVGVQTAFLVVPVLCVAAATLHRASDSAGADG